MSGEELARAALAVRGSRFRLGGRDPVTGLDCVGVLAAALAACGRPAPLPVGYALRSRMPGDFDPVALACGFAPATGTSTAGDVLLAACSPVQLHLLVAMGGERFVHAHAGLRRVVVGVRDPAWAIRGHWRLLGPD